MSGNLYDELFEGIGVVKIATDQAFNVLNHVVRREMGFPKDSTDIVVPTISGVLALWGVPLPVVAGETKEVD